MSKHPLVYSQNFLQKKMPYPSEHQKGAHTMTTTQPTITRQEILPGLDQISINGTPITRSMLENIIAYPVGPDDNTEDCQPVAIVRTGRSYTFYIETIRHDDGEVEVRYSTTWWDGPPVTLQPLIEILFYRPSSSIYCADLEIRAYLEPRGSDANPELEALPNLWPHPEPESTPPTTTKES